jgi:diguanylate cyclase (GGDEF)-like protein
MRIEAAADRDRIASARDLEASARDEAAEMLDRELAVDGGESVAGSEFLERASRYRTRDAADRVTTAGSRARAASDREHAAGDREQAAHDRSLAQADRKALQQQLAIMEIDPLTGARTRAAGLADLDREIDRAGRAASPLVIAYIDVVGLKAVNDATGHATGDALLQRAVNSMRHHLRPYDLIVRVGGDEFVCVMPGATIEHARQRFGAIQAALAADSEPCEITIGFAGLERGEAADQLIQRADADMLATAKPNTQRGVEADPRDSS